jgi:hypothetical protein
LCAGDDLEDAFGLEERTAPLLGADPAIRQGDLHSRTERAGKAAIGEYVTVFDYPDGRLAIRHRGVELADRTFDKVRQVDQAPSLTTNSCAAGPSVAVGRTGATKVTPASSRLAEFVSTSRAC